MSSSKDPPDPSVNNEKRLSKPAAKTKPGHEDFIFGKLIGEGSFSSVYLAREVATGKEYAIKVLEKSHIQREKKVEYVHREKEVYTMIQNHPFFVHLRCTFQDSERLYFVISYSRRGELLDCIKKLGCFDEKCTKFYTAEIVSALEFLKSIGIIHRDLKPENILLDDSMHIRITDFGSAKIVDKKGSLRRNSFVGTAQYVSPEVLKSKEVHYASDLWALGCIIYQLQSGKLPFWGGHEYQIFQKILALEYKFPDGFPEVSRDLVEKLLVIDPEERLGSDKTGGFEGLKSHHFFDGIQWENLHEQQPPDILPYLPPGGQDEEPLWGYKTPGYNPGVGLPGFDVDNSEIPLHKLNLISNKEEELNRQKKLQEQARTNKYHQFVEGNLIVKQGLLWKRKGLFSRCRMFLMTEGPHLYYVDPNNMVLKGQVPWSRELRPEPKKFKIFFIHTPNRTYYLEDPEGNALVWCKEIENHYAKYYGERDDKNTHSSS